MNNKESLQAEGIGQLRVSGSALRWTVHRLEFVDIQLLGNENNTFLDQCNPAALTY